MGPGLDGKSDLYLYIADCIFPRYAFKFHTRICNRAAPGLDIPISRKFKIAALDFIAGKKDEQ